MNAESANSQDVKEGLVTGYILDGRGGGQAASWDQVESWKPGLGILWVHLHFGSPKVQGWLRSRSGLDEVHYEALLAEDTRPRILADGQGMLATLRGINTIPGEEPDDMVSIRMWLDEKRIITVRRWQVLATQDIADDLEKGNGPRNAGEFLEELVRKLTNRVADSVGGIEDQVDEIEERALNRVDGPLRARLTECRRQLIGIRRYIVPQRDALSAVLPESLPWLSAADRTRLHESASRTMRYLEDIEAVRDRAAITQEQINSSLSEQMNRNTYVLSIVAAIFLPLGLLTGLLGINVGGIPGSEWRWAFALVCVILGALALLEYWLLKRRKYF